MLQIVMRAIFKKYKKILKIFAKKFAYKKILLYICTVLIRKDNFINNIINI